MKRKEKKKEIKKETFAMVHMSSVTGQWSYLSAYVSGSTLEVGRGSLHRKGAEDFRKLPQPSLPRRPSLIPHRRTSPLLPPQHLRPPRFPQLRRH